MATLIETLLVRVEADVAGLRKDLGRVEKDLQHQGRRMGNALNPMRAAIVSIRRELIRAAAVFGAFLAFRGVRSIVRIASDFEQLRVRLETVTGTAEDAEKAFNAILRFAVDTPFEVSNITDAFIKLRSVGIQPTQEMMEGFANAAAAFGRDITDYAQAVIGVAAGETERLKQFGIIARLEGDKIRVTFKGMTQEIDRNFESAARFFGELGNTEFAGGAQRQVSTLGGALSNLADAFSLAADEVGRAGLTETLTEIVQFVTRQIPVIVDGFKQLRHALGEDVPHFALANQILQIDSAIESIENRITAAAANDGKLQTGEFVDFDDLRRQWRELRDVRADLMEELTGLAAGAGFDGSSVGVEAPGIDIDFDKSAEAIGQLRLEAAILRNNLSDVQAEAARAAMALGAIGPNLELVPNLSDASKDSIIQLGNAIAELDRLNRIAAVIEETKTPLEKFNEEVAALEEIADAIGPEIYARKLQMLKDKLESASDAVDTLAEAIKSVEDRTAEVEFETALLAEGYNDVEAEIRRTLFQLGLMNKHLALSSDLTEEQREQIFELGNAMRQLDAAEQRREQSQEKMADLASRADDDIGRMEDSVREFGLAASSAFEDAVVGGEKFKDVVRGLLGDIQRMILRLTVTQPLMDAIAGSLFGAGSGSKSKGGGLLGTVLGGLGGLFTAGASGGGTASAGAITGFAKAGVAVPIPLASGGPVQPGSLYQVGERGPELFVPQMPGRILSAPETQRAMRGAGGGGSIVFHITAPGADREGMAMVAAELRTIKGELRNPHLIAQRAAEGFRRTPTLRGAR